MGASKLWDKIAFYFFQYGILGDSQGWVQQAFAEALEGIEGLDAPENLTMPHMRFLHYSKIGGGLPAHVDLARTDELGRRSTHTFILYLWTAQTTGETEIGQKAENGETVLLTRMEDSAAATLVAVEPRRGRLLLFPHMCPHLARPIASPKLLLRLCLSFEVQRIFFKSRQKPIKSSRWKP